MIFAVRKLTLLFFTTVFAVEAQVSVLTWHNDNARTGQNLNERILTPANVRSATFGKLGVLNVDGKVDAQPLYVPNLTIPNQGTHNVLYVATEADSLYAFDADTFTQLLHISLLGAGEAPSDDHGCSQVTPMIGVTATPVIDLSVGPHGTIYLIAMSKNSATPARYFHRLHALDITTFAEQFSGPVVIQATFPGSGAENTFNPTVHKERPGLLISGGLVYTSWGSHCDAGSYAGWVISYNETTLAQVGVVNLVPNGNDGGIWAAGSGPAADASGNIYVLTGNGTFDTTLNPTTSFPNKNDFGNAFVRLNAPSLTVHDYFTMTNTVSESDGDTDLGAAGLVVLPPLNNAQNQPVTLVVGAGKDKNIYVLDTTNMGKFNSSTDSIYQLLSNALPGGTWSSPAWFNGTLYYGGVSDNLKAFVFSGGSFALGTKSTNTFGFPGTTPSISANGTANGIVWAAENVGTAVLHAYDATNLATELYNSNQATGSRDHFGTGNKFIAPTIANGKVYVGTTSGVGVFGLLTVNPAPSLSITKTHSGSFAQGEQGATYTVTVSNNAGAAPTSGLVTVTDTLPSGLSLAGMSGTNWSCSSNTCTRSDVLSPGASYPVITVMVNVSASASSPQINSVSVTGGGSATAAANDSTIIGTLLPPVLTAPANGATAVSVSPTLTWAASIGATSYDVYLGASSSPPLLTNVTGTSFGATGLVGGAKYFWQIVAKNSSGTSASAIWSFTARVSPAASAVLRDSSGSIWISTYGSSGLANSGGILASDPSAAQDANNNTFVTARDNSNSIWANVYNPNTLTWNGWAPGGGVIQGIPSIAVDTTGTAWIGSRDNSNSYWLVSYKTSTGFGAWTSLLGIFSTDPVVTACPDGSIYLIGKDTFNSLWSGHYIPGTGFQGWQFGAGIVKGKPSATCGGDNAVYIAAEDNSNSNWMARVSGNTWNTWFLGGALTSVAPKVAALTGSVAVVIIDSSNVVWRTTYTEGTANGWQPWTQGGGILLDAEAAAIGGVLYIAGKSPMGDLWWYQQSGNIWTGLGYNGLAVGGLSASPR